MLQSSQILNHQLIDTDPNSMGVDEPYELSGWRREGIDVEVYIRAPASKGAPFKYLDSDGTTWVASVGFHASDRRSGERILAAIKNAARLCGARPQAF